MLPPRSVQSQPMPSWATPDLPHQPLPLATPTSLSETTVHLDFEDLALFEQVQTQYWGMGVRFEGAIAVQPSNPAFSPRSGKLVLMPVAGRPDITVYFRNPHHQVSAFLTGSRQVRLTAYDQDDRLVSESWGGQRHYVKTDPQQTNTFPRQHLELLGHPIAKVSFASEAPFILDDFTCTPIN